MLETVLQTQFHKSPGKDTSCRGLRGGGGGGVQIPIFKVFLRSIVPQLSKCLNLRQFGGGGGGGGGDKLIK